jgi:hypothetical protein
VDVSLVPSDVALGARLPRNRNAATVVSLALALTCVAASALLAAELSEAASKAFAEYANRARQSFLDRFNGDPAINNVDRAALRQGTIVVRPGSGDAILDAPGSLIHHWFAAIVIPGVTLDQVVSVSRSYRDYPSIFHPIMTATVLSDEGESLRVQFRMRESAAGMSATLDMTSRVVYSRTDARHAYVLSSADEIHEVKDAGRPSEQRLPPGRDSGYLWRAGAFTKFVEQDDGVYMEMETLGLSRPFPPMMGWMIELIARRIGRRSVEQSVAEFRQAVLKRYAKSP